MSLIAAYLSTLGSAVPTVQLNSNYLVADYVFDGGVFSTASAGFILTSDSLVQSFTTRLGDQTLGNWIVPPTSTPSLYEVRLSGLTGNSLATYSSAQNTWINLGTRREWYLDQSGIGSKYCSFTIEIRLGLNVLASTTVNLSAYVDELRSTNGGIIP